MRTAHNSYGITNSGTSYSLTGSASKPTIVLIHGLGLNRHIWEEYVPALSNHYQVLDFDLYGHGESAAPPVKPNLTVFSNQLRDLLDHLDINTCSIVGFSLGGMINRRFAMDHPPRLHALIILNSPHERGAIAQQLVEERATNTEAGGALATIESTLERWFTPHFRGTHKNYLESIRKSVLANEPISYAQCRQVLATGVLELIRPTPPICTPTLIITCANDSGSTPAMAYAISKEIAGSHVFIVPGLQHMGLVEQANTFIKPITDFLHEIYPPED
jgi:(E)-2-((N-methylformamido)methylene)succinate hydrolase